MSTAYNPLIRCSVDYWVTVRNKLTAPQWSLLYDAWACGAHGWLVLVKQRPSSRVLVRKGLGVANDKILRLTREGALLADHVFRWDQRPEEYP